MIDFLRINSKALLLLFLTWGLYFFFYWQALFFFNDAGDLVAGWRIIWADWAMHLSQVHAFAYQPFFHVLNNSPIYAGNIIAYPFLTNLISGLMLKSGFSLINAFVVPSIVFSFFLLTALFVFGRSISNSAAAALLGICLFLLSGGLEFYYYFQDVLKNPSFETMVYPPEHYTFLEKHGFYWKSVILSSLLPQRAMLLGMPWMLCCLTFLLKHYRNGFVDVRCKRMFYVGLLTGLLAIIHTHSLLVLFILCGVLFFTDIKNFRHWFSYGIGVACTAIPCLPYLVGENTSGFLEFYPGWYSNAVNEDQFFLWFWLKNWGLFFPLSCLAVVLLFVKSGRYVAIADNNQELVVGKERYLYLAFFLLFVLANIFKFQPFLWDNTKIFLWSYLGLSFLVGQLIVKYYNRNLLTKFASVLLMVLMCLSGLVDVVKSLHVQRQSYVMVPKDELDLAAKLREISAADDIVLSANYHLHFTATVTGRGILMGYKGWLWTYNVNYHQREKDIEKIYRGDPETKALLKKYSVDFVVIDQLAVKDYKASRSYFDKNFEKVLRSPKGDVYRINDQPR